MDRAAFLFTSGILYRFALDCEADADESRACDLVCFVQVADGFFRRGDLSFALLGQSLEVMLQLVAAMHLTGCHFGQLPTSLIYIHHSEATGSWVQLRHKSIVS